MIITDQSENPQQYIVKNSLGQIVKRVKSFNTETKEAEIYSRIELTQGVTLDGKKAPTKLTGIIVTEGDTTSLISKDGRSIEAEVVTFKCHLRGFNLYNRKTGELVR